MSNQKINDVLNSLFTGQIEISKKDLSELEGEVNKILEENLALKLEIQKLHLSEEVFKNNLGTIYSYLKDSLICKTCGGKISTCPKEAIGHRLYLTIDGNRVKTKDGNCQLYESLAVMLEKQIVYSSRERISLYMNAEKLLNLLSVSDNLKTMKSSAKAAVYVSKNIPYEKELKGLALSSLSDNTRVEQVLSLAAYANAKKGKKVVLADTETLFYLLGCKEEDKFSLGADILNCAAMSEVLVLLDLSSFPFYARDLAIKYLLPLLEKRAESNKITYVSYSGFASLTVLIKTIFTKSSKSASALNLVSKILIDYPIKDS